jgi:hypothetical protein
MLKEDKVPFSNKLIQTMAETKQVVGSAILSLTINFDVV